MSVSKFVDTNSVRVLLKEIEESLLYIEEYGYASEPPESEKKTHNLWLLAIGKLHAANDMFTELTEIAESNFEY